MYGNPDAILRHIKTELTGSSGTGFYTDALLALWSVFNCFKKGFCHCANNSFTHPLSLLLWRQKTALPLSISCVTAFSFLNFILDLSALSFYLEYSPLRSDNYRPRPPSIVVGKTSFILGGGRLHQSFTTYFIPRFSALQRQSHFNPKRRDHGRYRWSGGVLF